MKYHSQAARDARDGSIGNYEYWQYIDAHQTRMSEYFAKQGDEHMAELMLTESLSESLDGNDVGMTSSPWNRAEMLMREVWQARDDIDPDLVDYIISQSPLAKTAIELADTVQLLITEHNGQEIENGTS